MAERTEVALITGASGGIGRATAHRLVADGVAVLAIDIAEDRVAALVDELAAAGGRAVALAGDVTDPTLATRAVQLATAELGQPTILVNNAGIGSAQVPIWEVDPEDWRRDIEINLTSHFLMCRAVIPGMIDAGYGRIVNTASAAGMEGHPLAGGYAAAKAGLVAMTKTLGKELAQTGVIVNAIAPALIGTPMLEAEWFSDEIKRMLLERIPMKRLGRPEEVAEMIAFLASDRVTFSTGAVFDLSGGRATY